MTTESMPLRKVKGMLNQISASQSVSTFGLMAWYMERMVSMGMKAV